MDNSNPETCIESSSSENSDILDMKGEEGWKDIESDHEDIKFISLFDDEVFSDIHLMLNHCKEKYKFDFLETRQKLKLDFYDSIKLVNFIRTYARSGKPIAPSLTKEDFEDEKYLLPVMDNDAVLFNLDDLPDIPGNPDIIKSEETGKHASNNSELVARVSELEEQLRQTQVQFKNYKATVSQILEDRWHEKTSYYSGKTSEEVEKKQDDDSHYFSSYSYNGSYPALRHISANIALDIHETMLKDTVRTDAYRDFIYNHKNLFAGKTVLDVGCGTGILSMFCLKAGAARVIAVDNSSIIDKARENIFNNQFADKITCLRGKIEEVTLPVEAVDIIVSEWMGYCLLYEAMLDSVIWARDRYLRPNGLMVPSHMNMWVAPISDPDYISDHILFWRDVYGFDMKAMQANIYDDAQVLDMPAKTICGEPFSFLQLSLHDISVKDLTFTAQWRSKISADIDTLDGFVIWFDSFFMPSRDDLVPMDAKAEDWIREERKGVAFTTGPNGKLTHWKQCTLLIDNSKVENVSRKFGEEITAMLEYAVPKENLRALTISIKWKFGEEPEKTQSWSMV